MAKIRQEINVIDAIAGSASGIVLTDWGYVQLDTTQYSGSVTYYFEVVVSTASASSTVTLRRKSTTTDDASVSGTSAGRVRSTSFSPPSGQTEYGVYSSDTTVRIRAARIIVLQDTSTGSLTATETQVEIGNLESRAGTSITPLTYAKYWRYTPSKWDGTVTCYAEVTSKTASTNTHTVRLQEDDGLYANWTTKSTIVNAVSSTTTTRYRSASFTPTAGRNYRLAALSSSIINGYTIYNAKIIVQQAGTTVTRLEPQYMLMNTGVAGTGLKSYPTLFDADEWGGVTSTFRHSIDSDNAPNSALLEEDPYGYGFEETLGQSFKPTSSGSINKINLPMYKSGSPTDNAYIELHSDSVTGTLLGTSGSQAVSGLSAFPTASTLSFTFSPTVSVTSGTSYYMVVKRTGGRDQTNKASWKMDAEYANGVNYRRSSGIWSAGTEWDQNFTVYLSDVANVTVSGGAAANYINGGSPVVGSQITGTNQQVSSSLSITDDKNIDVDVTNSTGVIAASRLLAETDLGGDTETSVITYDAAVGNTGSGTSSSGSLAHAARVMVVITVSYAGTTSPLSVTIGNVSAALLKKQSQSTLATCEMYGLYREAAGTETVQVNFTASTLHAFSAASYTNAKRTVECADGSSGSGASPQTASVTITAGTAGRRIISGTAARDNAIGTGSITITEANGETERDERQLAGTVTTTSVSVQMQDCVASGSRALVTTLGKSGRTINWATATVALLPETLPDVTLSSPSDTQTIGTASLEFSGDDDQSDDITYQVQISDVTFPTTVFDAFKDGSIDPSLWTAEGIVSKVIEQDGKLQISHGATIDEYNTLTTVNTYDLTGTSFYVALVDVGDQSYVSHESIFGLRLDAANAVWFSSSNGELEAYKQVSDVNTQIGSAITYSPANHKYLRIRESGGTTYFDTSAAGSSWTNQWSLTNPFAVTALTPYLQSGLWQNEAYGSYTCFENFNINSTIFVDRISGQADGFENTDTAADTDPFISGDSIRFSATYRTYTVGKYFDASDASISDPNSVWTNDANAADGSLTTIATTSATGSTSSNYLKLEGTNVATGTGTIVRVRVRLYAGSSSAGKWGDYFTLSVPSGEWTWAKIQALETKIYLTQPGSVSVANAVVYTDGLAEDLGTTKVIYTSSTNLAIAKFEVEVTADEPLPDDTYYWRVRGGHA